MYIWLDSVDNIRDGAFIHCKSVNATKDCIMTWESNNTPIQYISIGHSAGAFAKLGGEYIELLKWLESTGRRYPVCFHTEDTLDIEEMRNIIRQNKWDEYKLLTREKWEGYNGTKSTKHDI